VAAEVYAATRESVWSKKNTEHAKRLIRSGRMQPAGYREIEAAKKDGARAEVP